MIKIPLRFIDDQIHVKALLDAPNYRMRFKPVFFILDTGSPRSFLSEGEALRLQFPINTFTETKGELLRMDGAKYHIFNTKPISLSFRTDQDQLHKIDFKNFAFVKSIKNTEEAKIESQNFPSILGVDFFILNNLFLHLDPKNNDIYIGSKD